MEFEKSIQSALKTLRTSLAHHESHKKGYERTIARLMELQKNVPPQSKVNISKRASLTIASSGRDNRDSTSNIGH